jgi:hypothetical protein
MNRIPVTPENSATGFHGFPTLAGHRHFGAEIPQNGLLQFAGWDVAYKYRGAVYQTCIPEKPGKDILVAVNVAPAPYFRGR